MKLVHEELAVQWVNSRPFVKDKAMAHGWFFFDAIVRSVKSLIRKSKHDTVSRTRNFPWYILCSGVVLFVN